MDEQEIAQRNTLYPDETWFQYASPEEAGYSAQQLEKAHDYFHQIDIESLLVIYDGAILVAWGDVTRRLICHSIRKSYMNALYGIHVNNGNIHLKQTLAELNIDDVSLLTETEKEARVIDLLASRSGVYHPAAAEPAYWTKNKPERGSHKPGSHWYYNNWDFNALLTIFEQETKACFFEQFKQKLADPLQMEEFRLTDTFYYFEKEKSLHPAYHFRMSAKDMARFGLLYLRQGRWKGEQIIPETWVKKSTMSHSDIDGDRGYGYLWWIIGPQLDQGRWHQLGMYEALGEQRISVIPGANLVVVFSVDTYQNKTYKVDQFFRLLGLCLDANTSSSPSQPELIPFQDPPKRYERIRLETSLLDKYIGDYEFEDGFRNCIRKQDNQLILTTMPAVTPPTYLLPISETEFILEDSEYNLTFALDSSDYQLAVAYNLENISYAKLV